MNLIKKTWVNIQPTKKIVREFGFLLTGFFLIALPLVGNLLKYWHDKTSFSYPLKWPALALGALVTTFAAPWLMRFIYRLAMLVATGISWVIMRVVLIILFYGVLTPIKIVMTLLGKDIIDQKINKKAISYWTKQDPKPDKSRYERLF